MVDSYIPDECLIFTTDYATFYDLNIILLCFISALANHNWHFRANMTSMATTLANCHKYLSTKINFTIRNDTIRKYSRKILAIKCKMKINNIIRSIKNN